MGWNLSDSSTFLPPNISFHFFQHNDCTPLKCGELSEYTDSAHTEVDDPSSRCMNGRKEGNVLFNDALNTFYLRLYGVGHMVKNHSDSERGNPLPPHGLLFPRVLLYAPSQRQDSTYHGLCYTSRGALAGTRNSSMGSLPEGPIRRPIAP